MNAKTLGEKLRSYYDNAYKNEKTAQIHLFGIEHGSLIKQKKIALKEIIKQAGLKESLSTELNKGIKLAGGIAIQNEKKDLKNLAKKLKEQTQQAGDGDYVASIHVFGIKYGKAIRRKNIPVKDLISLAGLNSSMIRSYIRV